MTSINTLTQRSLILIMAAVCIPILVGAQLPSVELPVSDYGKVIQIKDFKSAHVIPRNVEIWVPKDYDETSPEKYEVLYMHDGQNVFNAETAWTKVTWGIDHVVDSLVSIGRIDKTIIVGPWNTYEKRFSEFMPEEPKALTSSELVRTQLEANTGFDDLYSDEYLAFLVEELKPYIDENYNVYTDVEHTTVMGSSMGGLISLYAISKYPETFGTAGCVSSHWPVPILGDAYIGTLSTSLPSPENHKIYFDYGTEGLDKDYEPYQVRVDEIMKDRGYTYDDNWKTVKFPGAGHNETSWQKRLPGIIEFLLGK